MVISIGKVAYNKIDLEFEPVQNYPKTIEQKQEKIEVNPHISYAKDVDKQEKIEIKETQNYTYPKKRIRSDRKYSILSYIATGVGIALAGMGAGSGIVLIPLLSGAISSIKGWSKKRSIEKEYNSPQLKSNASYSLLLV